MLLSPASPAAHPAVEVHAIEIYSNGSNYFYPIFIILFHLKEDAIVNTIVGTVNKKTGNNSLTPRPVVLKPRTTTENICLPK